MRPFRYAFDPLCLIACVAYGLNRWILEPVSSWAFLHEHFNDLLLIPAALPPLLWLQRRLGLRTHDLPPTGMEIAGHWLVWSIVSEGIGPHLFAWATGDILDVAAYAIGAIAADIWWNRQSGSTAKSTGFDLLAVHYDWMETILAGRKLEHCRNAFWSRLPSVKTALLAGEGHGKFLVELLRRHPNAEITCVDSSIRMLEVSRRRLERNFPRAQRSQVKFIHVDLLEWRPPTGEFDLVSTHFFLDCFTEEQLSRLIPHLAAAVKTDANWLISDFQIPSSALARQRASIIHWLMYRFFRLAVDLPATVLVPPFDFLRRHGLTRVAHQEFDWGLLYCDLWKKSAPMQAIAETGDAKFLGKDSKRLNC
ncbi:MAG TPA: class I SAM-dependent methyltransferase [Chthoniobacterales bacterium]